MNKNEIIKRIIVREGGYSDHESDGGGATRYGVTEKTARRHGYEGDMRELPEETAAAIFSSEYWAPVRAGSLPQDVREQVVDFCVLAGPGQAGKALQRAVNAFGGGLKVDGVVGSKTTAAAARCDGSALSVAFSSYVSQYLISIAKRRPDQQVFLKGWLTKRVYL